MTTRLTADLDPLAGAPGRYLRDMSSDSSHDASSSASDAPIRALDVPVRPAATVMLIRDGDDGIEVFMLRRTLSAAFAGGQFVFPGGKVDGADHADDLEAICDGLDDEAASARLGLERGGLAWLVAAIRESFEEAGVLLARRAHESDMIRFDDDIVDAMQEARGAIHRGERTLAEVCTEHNLRLVTDAISFVSHWITPVGEGRRFDTRFLLARAPAAQHPLHDGGETIESLWVRPSDALTRWKAGELQMFPPTALNLEWLTAFSTADEALAAGEAMGVPQSITPRVRTDDSGNVLGIAMPGDADYDTVPLPEFLFVRFR